ncbi:MAG: hypothetical protein ACPGJV_04875 [Bacteriovoracaceae bacterium]
MDSNLSQTEFNMSFQFPISFFSGDCITLIKKIIFFNESQISEFERLEFQNKGPQYQDRFLES